MPIAVYEPPPGPVVVPVPRAPLYYPEPEPATWDFAYGDWRGLPTMSLPTITGRSVTWRLTPDNHEASFTIDGSLDEAAGINEVTSDLWVARNGVCLYRGVFSSSNESGDADMTETVQYNSADYTAMLARRMLNDSDSRVYSSLDQAQIAWLLIQQAQAAASGGLNIVQGSTTATGIVPPTTTFEPGTWIRDLINQLAQTPTGFDWDIRPSFDTVNQTFDVWFPQRGVDRRKILDYPGQITNYSRSVDVSQYANTIRGTGDSATSPITAVSPSITSDGVRRIEDSYGNSDLLSASALTAAVQNELTTKQLLLPSYTVTLQPNIWSGPGDVWLGDPVTLYIKRTGSRPDVLRTLRVQEIKLDIDDESESSTVSLTLGAPKPDRRWRYRVIDRRIAALERR